MRGRVLVVAGSDSSGGAGIQADLKTVMALGGYAMTAITALTAQDTAAVHGIIPVPPDFVALQMRSAVEDIGADAAKTGMLGDAGVIEAVCASLPDGVPVVVDPVMIATSGAELLPPDSLDVLRRRLLPRADVLTPNLPEAEALLGIQISNLAAMREAALHLRDTTGHAVLVKGGHLPGPLVHDVLASAAGIEVFEAPRIASRDTHGTGCTLASAIATGLALGMNLRDSVLQARAYVRAAIAAAPGLGRGFGPVGHGMAAAAIKA